MRASASPYSGPGSSLQFDGLDFIHIAPGPGFAGLNGAYQRVFTSVIVLGGVLIFRRIAATDMSAFETHPQVNPGVPGFYAVLANVLVGLGKLNLIQVRALQRH